MILWLAWSTARADDGLTVLAAASLTEALQRAAEAWTAQGNPPIALSFDASSRLARQLDAGAPADLFFSADAAWMDWLAERSLVDPTTRVDLVGNALVVVVPADSTLTLTGAADLVSPAVRHLAIAGASVPAGRYARAALGASGEALAGRMVQGDDVRSVLAWVAAGEAEAGFVYATDARIEPRVKVAWEVPAGAHPPIVYPAAVVAASKRPSEAAAFLAWCRSEAGLAPFAAAGFRPPAPR